MHTTRVVLLKAVTSAHFGFKFFHILNFFLNRRSYECRFMFDASHVSNVSEGCMFAHVSHASKHSQDAGHVPLHAGGDLLTFEHGHCIRNARHLNHYTMAPPKLTIKWDRVSITPALCIQYEDKQAAIKASDEDLIAQC
ncbi:hypothetical protein HELRODRAFT_182796 [Helobdella robusta]|uniref:Uncharacterized protein n=1 Tax=Helobdella robusta TaxID=6412 RepID=T1FIR4_HELRO|nr:hypothetical protein HELRODRAFT_182796 [Helobdella robusta]ESN90102.1 hypothetical protein HELRODRAFT_182796 [Helobdella robusta]